jgi:hypothetical protein
MHNIIFRVELRAYKKSDKHLWMYNKIHEMVASMGYWWIDRGILVHANRPKDKCFM